MRARATAWATFIALFVALAATPSEAQEPPARTRIVLDAQGSNAFLLRKTLLRALTRAGYDVVFAPAGTWVPEPSPENVRRKLRKRNATALVTGQLDRRRSRVVLLRVYRSDGTLQTSEIRWRARSLGGLRRVPPRVLTRLKARIAAAAAPQPALPVAPVTAEPTAPPTTETPAAVSEPQAPTAPPTTETPAAVSKPQALTAPSESEVEAEIDDDEIDATVDEPEALPSAATPLELALGVRVFTRRFLLDDTPTQPLPRYRLPLGPAVVAEVDWYPGAHFTRNALAHLGVTAGIGTGFALRSTVGPTVFPTDALSLSIGAKGRLPLGPATLSAAVSYASRSFTFLPSLVDGAAAPVADVRYVGPHFALEARFAFAKRWSVGAGAGYHLILQAGEVAGSAFFPRLTASAVDARLFAMVTFMQGWGVKASADFMRAFLTTNAEAGDVNLGERGFDQSFGASLAIVFSL